MAKRPYYSQRRGTNPASGGIDFNTMKSLIMTVYNRLEREGYFQQAFGKDCVDGFEPGTLGEDVSASIFFKLRKTNVWPFQKHVGMWEEDDLFDVVEFLYDHVSKPTDGRNHSFANCGMHWSGFDAVVGQHEYREAINEVIEEYETGYVLTDKGEVLRSADPGTAPLLDAPIPTKDATVKARMEAAIHKFRRHGSSIEDRHDAVRTLADACEQLRPQLEKVLKRKDEAELFLIANQFGIRHFNGKQKTDYDQSIWLSWMFYHFLATLHASLRLIDKRKA